jgi:hypothetical protein
LQLISGVGQTLGDDAREVRVTSRLYGKGGAMEFVRPLASLMLLWVGANHAYPQERPTPERPPIIDMHIHAFSWDHQGNPPPPSPVTGKVPPARTDKEAMEASLAELRRYNVVRAVAGGRSEHVSRWYAADPERIIGGTMMPLLDVSVLRKEFLAGQLGVMGELALAYAGMAPNDAQMEPYWALAEELGPTLRSRVRAQERRRSRCSS